MGNAQSPLAWHGPGKYHSCTNGSRVKLTRSFFFHTSIADVPSPGTMFKSWHIGCYNNVRSVSWRNAHEKKKLAWHLLHLLRRQPKIHLHSNVPWQLLWHRKTILRRCSLVVVYPKARQCLQTIVSAPSQPSERRMSYHQHLPRIRPRSTVLHHPSWIPRDPRYSYAHPVIQTCKHGTFVVVVF